jgi:hypothetical protein
VFPGEGFSLGCFDAECGFVSPFTFGCGGCAFGDTPMRFMLEAFPRTQVPAPFYPFMRRPPLGLS